MSYILSNNTVQTTTDNVTISAEIPQLSGYEQFVSVSGGYIEEILTPDTDFSLVFDYAIPVMDSNSQYGSVYGESILNQKDAFVAFDRNNYTIIQWNNSYGSVMYKSTSDMFIHSYTITTPVGIDVNNFPNSWKILGSIDGVNWIELDEKFNISMNSASAVSFECKQPFTVRQIKFEFYSTKGGLNGILSRIDFLTTKSIIVPTLYHPSTPVATANRDGSVSVTTFKSILPKTNIWDDQNPIKGANCLLHIPCNGDTEDKIGLYPTTSNMSSYVDFKSGYKGIIFNKDSEELRTVDKIPFSSMDSANISLFVRSEWFSYGVWQNIVLVSTTTSDVYNNNRVMSLFLSSTNSTQPYISIYSNGINTNNYGEIYDIKRRQWVFISINFDRNGIEVYADGVLINKIFTTQYDNIFQDAYVIIGDKTFSNRLAVSQVRLFDRALTLEEMSLLRHPEYSLVELNGELPLAHTFISSRHYLNGKLLNLDIESIELNKTLKEYRYIKHTLAGNSVDLYNHVVEIQALDNLESTNYALNKPVIVQNAGSNKQYITDGNLDSNLYYSSSGTDTMIIDLGEPKPIRFIKMWHYYSDNRTYYNQGLYLSNNPSNFIENWDKVWLERDDGRYTETSAGKYFTNEHYNYSFKIKYKINNTIFVPEYKIVLSIWYKNTGSSFVGMVAEINRNLWHLKPRAIKHINEQIEATDEGHIAFKRTKVLLETSVVEDFTANIPVPYRMESEYSKLDESIVRIINSGFVQQGTDDLHLIESINYITTSNTVIQIVTENIDSQEVTYTTYKGESCS